MKKERFKYNFEILLVMKLNQLVVTSFAAMMGCASPTESNLESPLYQRPYSEVAETGNNTFIIEAIVQDGNNNTNYLPEPGTSNYSVNTQPSESNRPYVPQQDLLDLIYKEVNGPDGSHVDLRMDCFLAENQGGEVSGNPFAIYLPGGWYDTGGDRTTALHEDLIIKMRNRGLSICAADVRYVPTLGQNIEGVEAEYTLFPGQALDTWDAFDYLLDHAIQYGLTDNLTETACLGSSAGGAICLETGVLNFSDYGIPIDTPHMAVGSLSGGNPYYTQYQDGTLGNVVPMVENLLGMEEIDPTWDDSVFNISYEQRFDPADLVVPYLHPQMLRVQGDNDPLLSLEYVELAADLAANVGVTTTLYPYAGGHGITSANARQEEEIYDTIANFVDSLREE